jgi:cytochrome c peroxidase
MQGARVMSQPGWLSAKRFVVLACGMAFLAAVERSDAREAATGSSAQREPVRPIPATVNVDARKVALGERLFHDALLSRDGKVSCASCHSLQTGGTDRRQRSVGLGGVPSQVNAPTVLNCGFSFKQFWDGRAETLEEQVDGPLLSAAEMGSTWPEVLAKLGRVPGYVKSFGQIYPNGISRDSVRNAIAEYERSLITPNARFDRYLRGEDTAITAAEKSGWRKFKAYGCVSCHQGMNVGGNMFQRMGVMGDYFADRGKVTAADLGRFNVTGDEMDRHTFKVPSLRNVAITAPYFHDGSAQTLDQAVTVMARYQLGRELPPQDREELVAFLRTLTGELPGTRR